MVRRAPDEPELFEALFRRHVSEVHRFIWRRTRNDMIADDITAATFEKCWLAIPTFRPQRTTVRPWLYRIAANELASHFRSEGRRADREQLVASRERPFNRQIEGLDPDLASPDPLLLAAIGRLNDREQAVLSFRFFADLTTEEAARALGVRRNHFAVLQNRALASLRREMEGVGDV